MKRSRNEHCPNFQSHKSIQLHRKKIHCGKMISWIQGFHFFPIFFFLSPSSLAFHSLTNTSSPYSKVFFSVRFSIFDAFRLPLILSIFQTWYFIWHPMMHVKSSVVSFFLISLPFSQFNNNTDERSEKSEWNKSISFDFFAAFLPSRFISFSFEISHTWKGRQALSGGMRSKDEWEESWKNIYLFYLF